MPLGAQLDTLSFSDPTTLTIATGVVTLTKSYHTIAAETGTTDDLVTITPPSAIDSGFSQVVYLIARTGDTITLKHGTGNILLANGDDFLLSGDKVLVLFEIGTNWHDVAGSVSADEIAGVLPGASYTLNEVADYTTTSTSFVDVDATKLSLTITTNGGNVRVDINVVVSQSAAFGIVYFDVTDNGVRVGGDDGVALWRVTSVTDVITLSTSFPVTGVSAGAHTYKLQWKIVGGSNTATMYAGSGTSAFDVHTPFAVKEE